MKFTLPVVLALAVLAWPIVNAVAQAPVGKGPGRRQASAAYLGQFDRDQDGRLNTEERKAAYELAQQRIGQGKGGGKPGKELAPAQPGPKLLPTEIQPHPDAPLYDATAFRTFFLEFENPEWEKELAAFHRSDVDIPATLIVDGQRFQEVGVHFHGASSFEKIPAGHKRSLVVSLDFVHAGQRLLGYRTLRLLNAHEDPSFLRTVLSQHISRHYVPAPKANLARVVINGENWGVYVNVQQFNKDFLKEWYGTTKGVRWKVLGGQAAGLVYLGENPADYQRTYEIKSKDDPAAWASLVRLCRVLNETPAASLEQALQPILAVDETLKFLALENVLMNKDGYWTKGADFNLYLDEKGVFHLIPYDANETFFTMNGKGKPGGKKGDPQDAQAAGSGAPAQSAQTVISVGLDPLVAANDPRRPLLSRLLQVPAWRARYLGYVRAIAEQWLNWDRLGPLAMQYRDLLNDPVKVDTRKLYSYEAFCRAFTDEPSPPADQAAGAVISLKAFAQRRRAYLLEYNP